MFVENMTNDRNSDRSAEERLLYSMFPEMKPSKERIPYTPEQLEKARRKIGKVLSTLTYREREVLKLRYGLGDGYAYTLGEVGKTFNITRERIRQVEAKAIRKLQSPERRAILESLLDEPPSTSQ